MRSIRPVTAPAASVCTADTVITDPSGDTCSRPADFVQPQSALRVNVNSARAGEQELLSPRLRQVGRTVLPWTSLMTWAAAR